MKANSSSLRHPVWELLARYRTVGMAAWAAREDLAGPRRLADETAFLPAALSVQETPVHPAPRRAMVVIVLLFFAALAWSWIGQVDVVAVAPGRIIVSDRTKVIQPLEAAVVKAIHVKEGQSVRAGQLLIELDPTGAQADKRTVEEQLAAASVEVDRANSLLAALETGTDAADTHATTRAEWADIRSRMARLDAEHARRRAELATVGQQLTKLNTLLPLARQREADVKGLADQGFLSNHASQDRLRERMELEGDRATALARTLEVKAALAEGVQAKAAFLAETRRALHDRLAKAELERSQLKQQGAKAAQRERQTQLVAPVAGTVQQLAVHTPAAVVTPAQPLMVIVPDAAEVVAEVSIDNKDIGFVQLGQDAVIKLETFSFTRFGTLAAQVSSVSADALVDEKRGALFRATLVLSRDSLQVDGKTVRIAPGMNLTAEIKTGRRRVIDFLLSPIQRHADESLRER